MHVPAVAPTPVCAPICAQPSQADVLTPVAAPAPVCAPLCAQPSEANVLTPVAAPAPVCAPLCAQPSEANVLTPVAAPAHACRPSTCSAARQAPAGISHGAGRERGSRQLDGMRLFPELHVSTHAMMNELREGDGRTPAWSATSFSRSSCFHTCVGKGTLGATRGINGLVGHILLLGQTLNPSALQREATLSPRPNPKPLRFAERAFSSAKP
eukprot:360905-Chlamydomonas_euryale.AAC.3